MAPKSKTDSAYFQPGSAVGVSIDDDVGGFSDSWFSGAIVRRVASGRFLVEYHNLVADEQSRKPLREVLCLHQLRPLLPPERRREFKSGDKVEAFHNNGLWEARVTEDLGNGRFGVNFRDSEELLRAHREWINDKPQGISKRKRNRGQDGGENEVRRSTRNRKVDRISELPDSILLHIMNLLETKDAVRTCVLSKRWKDLCKSLTHLTFDRSYRRCRTIFEKFACWVLSNRDDSCSVFKLVIKNWISLLAVDRVIKYALFHNVQQLKMNITTGTSSTFQSLPLIFCCQSLTSLKLCISCSPYRMMILPKSLHLPSLKSLHLECVGFTPSDNDCAEPFSNCHVLNTLVLKYCSLHFDARVLSISNSSLSSLTICSLYKDILSISNSSLSSLTICSLYKDYSCEIVLSTPNLSSCTIMGFSCHQFSSTCNLSFLDEVNIFDLHQQGKFSVIIGWLQVLANVKILTLTSAILQLILPDLSNPSPMRPKLPCFVRLESIEVKRQLPINISDEEVTKVVEYLLQNSPMAKVDIITCDCRNANA